MILLKMQPASWNPPYHIAGFAPWNASTIPVETIQLLAVKRLGLVTVKK